MDTQRNVQYSTHLNHIEIALSDIVSLQILLRRVSTSMILKCRQLKLTT